MDRNCALAAVLLVFTPLAPPTEAAKRPDRAESVPATLHAIQGSDLVSPFAGSEVVTEGIVTARTGDGFFLQTPDGATDALAATSEGLFVFLGAAPGANASVGHHVRVTGTVDEYRPPLQPHQLTLTRLHTVTAHVVLATAQPLPAPLALPLEDLAPDSDIAALERFEGMRVTVEDLVVVGAAGASINETAQTAVSDGVVHVIAGVDAFAGNDVEPGNVPFREPGLPLLDASTPPAGKTLPVFDGNPEVLRVDSRAQPGAPLLDLGMDDRIRNAVGVLGYAGGRYSLLVDPVSPLQVLPGYRGEGAATDVPGEIKLLWLDAGRLYDASDDPARAEPVPSAASYQARLAKLASGLCTFLGNPDIVAVSGVEDVQVLRDLAAVVQTNPSGYCPALPNYYAVLPEGIDPSGLDIGLLLSGANVLGATPRVEVLQAGPIAASETSPHPAGGSERLFVQPPLHARLRITDDQARQADLSVVAVKLLPADGADSSAPGSNGWATQGERVMTLRTRQAARLAAWLEARQLANPNEAIAVLGGFEADTFNDGRVDVMGIISGRPAPAQQTWVAVPNPITTPLDNLTALSPARARYSANDRGDFRALDHILVNQAMRTAFAITPMHPRMNADFPASQRVAGGSSFTFSARDPLLARLRAAAFTDADTSLAMYPREETSSRVDTELFLGVDNLGPDTAPELALRVTSNLAPASWTIDPDPLAWTCGAVEADGTGSAVICRLAELAPGYEQLFTLRIPADLALDGVTAEFRGTLTGAHSDPDLANNQGTAIVAFNNNTDVSVELLFDEDLADLVPGTPGEYFVALRRATLNPPGNVTVVMTIDALASETTLSFNNPALSCDSGADIGPRRSRFTCVMADNGQTEMAFIGVSYVTLLGDGRRQIGFTVQATPTTPENTPADNVASGTRRVSDNVDLEVFDLGVSPEPARLDEALRFSAGMTNTILGVARNARLEIEVDVPPAQMGAFSVVPTSSGPAWTCSAAQATAGGSRVVCSAPALLPQLAQAQAWYFTGTLQPEWKTGLAQYPVTVSIAALSDSEETLPANNSAQQTVALDQTTDLSVNARALGDEVTEPGVAHFAVDVYASGTNAPRSPRATLALNAAFAPQELAIFNHLDQPVLCSPEASPVGTTKLDCPVAYLFGQALRVEARTRPSLADTTLELSATVRNDLVDSQPADNTASGGVRVIAIADLCIAPSCINDLTVYPSKINSGGVNTFRFPIKNLGPSTARESVAHVEVSLPPDRLVGRIDGRDCSTAVDNGGGQSRLSCALGNLPGDARASELTLEIEAGGLPAGNIALSVEVASAVTDPEPANNRIEFTLPVAPLMDLSVAVTSKAAKFPGNATFLITTAAEGPPNVALSELYVRVQSPGSGALPQLSGAGWTCYFTDGSTAVSNFTCRRLDPLSGGVRAPVVLTVPTAGFLQIGTDIRVLVEHYYRPEALANDRTPANNLVNHSRRVEGRSTQSVRTPAYGSKPAAAPKPAPARPAPARLN